MSNVATAVPDGLLAARERPRSKVSDRKGFGFTARCATPAWLRFFQQFNQPLVYILLLAVAVPALPGERVDSSVILGVVLINAVVGFL